jgi:hypothetical protein
MNSPTWAAAHPELVALLEAIEEFQATGLWCALPVEITRPICHAHAIAAKAEAIAAEAG